MSVRIGLCIGMVAILCSCAAQVKEAVVAQKEVLQEATQAPEAPAPAEAKNPFFEVFDTPFGVPPFEKIKVGHYVPAVTKGIEQQKTQVDEIANSTQAPTFANTVEALDRSGELLSKVLPVFFSIRSAHTNDQVEKVAEQVVPLLTKHRDDIYLNDKLFQRIRAIYEQQKELSLTVEQKTLLEDNYQRFVRAGANLGQEQKLEARAINEKLSVASLKFSQNILKENNRFEMVLDNKADLAGLPQRVITGAEIAAKERNHEGKWVFTLHKPSLIPFLQYSDKRELREKMFKGYIERGNHGDELDNKGLIAEIIALRLRKANLLGYKTFADFTLDRRMAKTADAVTELLDEVWKPALAASKKEAKALQKMIRKSGEKFKLEAWDWWYYTEKLRKAKYALDESELRPYFKMENVRDGAFDLAARLYGIKFVPRTDLPVYHPEVTTFEVLDADGSHLGVFYVDYFPRASKRGGAWCGGFRSQTIENGKRIAPIVTNVGNFSKPTGDKPALLSMDEVETLFHEFGHALHSLFSNVTYDGLQIETDFVELPSQIMENWAWEPEFLKTYARHYETNEPIPEALIEKIQKSDRFNQGFITLEYLAACYLDMAWHTLEKPTEEDVMSFENKVLKKLGLIPEIVTRYRSPYFAHIFSGAFYAAGYYSYIWSAVLDADAFQAFKETGLFDKTVAASFRDNVLSRGGSEDPMALYKRFRGAAPKTRPLLVRKGFKK